MTNLNLGKSMYCTLNITADGTYKAYTPGVDVRDVQKYTTWESSLGQWEELHSWQKSLVAWRLDKKVTTEFVLVQK